MALFSLRNAFLFHHGKTTCENPSVFQSKKQACLDFAVKACLEQHGISKRIGLLLSGEDIQRDNDERPDFMRISPPSGDHGSVVLGIEHFRIDHFSRELTNNRVGSYGIGYEKNLKRSVDTWQPQISSDKEIPAGALKSIGELVAQLLSQQIQATYNSFISAFSYSLNKHIDSIDYYHSQLERYAGNHEKKLGDAYEYLMTMYASGAGKSGGEFFTPADVSELLTRLGTVGKTEINKVYDPACGSGSLLLKAEKILGKDAVRNGFYGQEINITTYNLCRINMFLHDVGFDKFDIACEDTLTAPQHWDDEPFELIVSNPPYSIKWAGDDNPLLINDPRFSPAGVLAPKSKADMAFIMHSLSWLATNGTAAIVCFPGIMYRGGAEQKIRKYLIDNNFIDCIIQLPSNLFFGTSIATCIMVLKKGKSDNKTLFIDASNECIKVTNNNKLTQANMDRIVETFTKRAEETHFSHLANYAEIAENDYNLSVSTYIEAEDTREKIDIVKLNAEIAEIVAREQILRDEIDKIIAELEGK